MSKGRPTTTGLPRPRNLTHDEMRDEAMRQVRKVVGDRARQLEREAEQSLAPSYYGLTKRALKGVAVHLHKFAAAVDEVRLTLDRPAEEGEY